MGVASGDPSADGVVLWTGLRRIRNSCRAVWVFARDEAMRHIVQKGTVAATPELGQSVHVEVAGLKPGAHYFYRFHTGDATSPVGRTKTAPAAKAASDAIRFAFASCQHYEDGFYGAPI